MMKDGGDIATSVVLEESMILPDLKNIPDAIALQIGLLSLTIDEVKELKFTFEVILKVLIRGEQFLTQNRILIRMK